MMPLAGDLYVALLTRPCGFLSSIATERYTEYRGRAAKQLTSIGVTRRASAVVITPSEVFSRPAASREPTRSVSGNDHDGDDNECRHQRKNAIKPFRSGPCGSLGRRHGLFCRLWFVNEPADIPGFHWI
jgi:hypothetical protein